MKKNNKKIEERLKYLKDEIKKERISYGEILELESLKDYIKNDDFELLEFININKGRLNKKL